MSASIRRRRGALVSTGAGGAQIAVACAANIYETVDRRMPEADALASWLRQTALTIGFLESTVVEDLSFSRPCGRGVSAPDWRKMGTAIRSAVRAHADSDPSTPVDQWVATISEALALDPLEARLYAIGFYYHIDHQVARLFDVICVARGRVQHFNKDAALLALLLRTTAAEVEIRLAPDARLRTTGLFHLDPQHGSLDPHPRLLSLMRQGVWPEADFHSQILGSIGIDTLPWESFEHLGQEAEVAASLLGAALSGRETGINVLLYGAPGTGKTSFAAALAARVGARLGSVAETDEGGDEPARCQRLAKLRLAHTLAAPGKTLLLFDEAEDLFNGRLESSNSRVFIHRLLERMATPVIWTANNIDVLGPAVLRRMTMCIELKLPGQTTRARLWRRMGEAEGVMLPEADAMRLARLVPAAPAVASTALRATRLAGGDVETARLIVEGVARAVHGGGLPAPEPQLDALYDPDLVNADCDLAALTTSLLRPGASRAVSFLLCGPPGAGKSAWARHLAAQMGLPVLHKRASDLLDRHVGGTEHNIAAAFAEARETRAFLVFDEADSLLQERAGAVRSWEITQVNEMLTWMEQHASPFACTTNLADRLDQASLRRFMVKIRFDFMTKAQAQLAFLRCFGLDAPDGLDELDTLTPADFSLVRRRAALTGEEPDPTTLSRLLADECAGRTARPSGMGFIARAAR
ncbi:AAA family ATPase [Methylocella sp.]|uniref:ATP-binding protein n=1 Tax=Methylocella sp. TaxID=1978226 RepID=UPI00378450AF